MQHEDSRNRVFPVGLYGTLLLALFGVTFPDLVAPLETGLRTVVCLPLRAYSIAMGDPTALAADAETWWTDAVAIAQQRAATVDALGPSGLRPQVYRVRARREGPRGLVDELELDAANGELQDCASLVTLGPALVGFLDRRGGDAAPARVRLLHYLPRRDDQGFRLSVAAPALPIRVAASARCRDIDVNGTLRFLVEPARSVDSWPLRCTLLDDSYLASCLRRSGELVSTVEQFDDPSLPAGLHLGRLMIWGYPQRNIPVGLFVQPAVDPRGISVVALWRPPQTRSRSHLQAAEVGREVAVRLSRYPAPRPGGERWMVTSHSQTTLPDGAALLDRGRFLGSLHQPWSGQSLVTPFAASARVWAFVLLDAAGLTHDLVGQVVGRAVDGRIRIQVESSTALPPGQLYLGVNGPHCPAGTLIGAAHQDAGPTPLEQPSAAAVVELLVQQPAAAVLEPVVFVGGRPPVEEGPR